MDIDLLTVFEEATQQIFAEIGFSDLDSIEPKKPQNPQDIVATVGITGALQGYISLSTSKKYGHAFVQKMFENLDIEIDEQGFGQFHQEALAEIVNQITGRSTTLLEQKSYNCDITPPTIMVGSELSFNLSRLTESFHRLITGEFGSILLFVGIQNINVKEEQGHEVRT